MPPYWQAADIVFRGLNRSCSQAVQLLRPRIRILKHIDDASNVSAGYGPEVQDNIVKCALMFNSLIVVKRKFRLSGKSAVVSSDRK